jgi:translation initiation factor 2 gamma subunit (eIF-2gamma)
MATMLNGAAVMDAVLLLIGKKNIVYYIIRFISKKKTNKYLLITKILLNEVII